jgi:hypothetical protein
MNQKTLTLTLDKVGLNAGKGGGGSEGIEICGAI